MMQRGWRAAGLGLAMAAGAYAAVQGMAPKAVAPGEKPGDPPADAVVLFDGKSTEGWTRRGGGECGWIAADGELRCKPGAGDVVTTAKFGDAQIHVEFATPLMPDAKGQGRGNSGVYLQGRYEVQVLDSYKAETYPDGQCAAVYKQAVPLVNACRPPLEWQTYDIVFHQAKLGPDGKKSAPARVTMFHNGVLVHDDVELKNHSPGEIDKREGTPGPILLQDHGNTVKFRNLWYRPL
ncbi:MAG TPA: DUF1080 domain-containing protein [Planctomycetia bacterium]|nr:DUF1080 domain-containing protein [Planctomycetia bacterium]